VEYFARAAWDQYKLPYTIVRPFNCVGIGEGRALGDEEVLSGNVKLAMSHVVPDLVQKVLKGQDPLHILGAGEQVRHYTYGGDLARGIVGDGAPGRAQRGLQPVDRRVTTVLELAETDLAEDQGPGRAVPVRQRRPVRVRRAAPRARTPVEKAREVLGFEATTSYRSDEMLDEVIPWIDLPTTVTLLLAVYTGVIVLAGRWLGELQGDERFLRLALGMAILAAGRYGGLIAGLLFGAGLTGSVLVGTAVAVLILPALAVLARRPTARPGDAGITARQVFTACSAMLAMLAVSYADLILARDLLPADTSGAYAVGTVLTKGALWAPQVVTVLALPRLAQGSRRALVIALGLVAGSGAVLILASAVAGGVAFRLAGGPGYVGLGRYAPVFATVGALYALVFVLVNARVAMGARWPSAPLWAAVVALVVAAEWLVPHTFPAIMWCAAGTAALALAATAFVTVRGAGSPLPAGPAAS
jgi:hypothetical protein